MIVSVIVIVVVIVIVIVIVVVANGNLTLATCKQNIMTTSTPTSTSTSTDAPLLVGILANKDPAAKQYAEWTGKACRNDGLRYELRVVDDPLDVENVLVDANEDPRVHGIIVYYPIFGQQESFSGVSHDDYLRDSVSIRCDVEGLCHTYRTNLYRNVRFLDYPTNDIKCLLPCTALSVVKILEHCPGVHDSHKPVGQKMAGKIVTVINRSEIVGRPLAAMLANDGATVYSIDIDSIYLFTGGRLHQCDKTTVTVESCVRQSHIVVTGVPTRSYRLPTEWIQPNTTVVNVASFKNVDEEELLRIPGVVYVPQVGKVTVAMLERNLVRLFENFHVPRHYEQQKQRPAPAATTAPASTTAAVWKDTEQPWYGNVLQLYTAVAVTALLAIQLSWKR